MLSVDIIFTLMYACVCRSAGVHATVHIITENSENVSVFPSKGVMLIN